MSRIILFLSGVISGIISGMGIGGGTVLIPILSIFFAYTQKQAQLANLYYFLPTAIIALITHIKAGRIEKRILPRLIVLGTLGAIIGSLLALRLDDSLLRKLFGFFLLFMSITEIKKSRSDNL